MVKGLNTSKGDQPSKDMVMEHITKSDERYIYLREDTRHSFTDNLYKALSDWGIHTFMDEKKLLRGEKITSTLEKAIEESKIFIIMVDVRNHTGSFGKALANDEKKFKSTNNMEKLETWKMALNQVANFSGYHHFKHREEYKYEFIQRIIELVSKEINRAPLHVADYPVGLESQMQEVKELLDVGSDDKSQAQLQFD
ncbi:hypothetical protein JHK86_052461 [Glycine max]|nr:hypothetical protein JHK86_052461 [Glycine max]